MNDLIDRQAAIKAIHDEFDACLVWDESGKTTANEVERILGELPSAQPERKKGTWITKIRHEHYPSGKEYKANYCSLCGRRGSLEFDFCPNCGADMRGDQDETD